MKVNVLLIKCEILDISEHEAELIAYFAFDIHISFALALKSL